MINTFPEYEDDLKPYLQGIVEEDDNKVSELFEHCKKVYPSGSLIYCIKMKMFLKMMSMI